MQKCVASGLCPEIYAWPSISGHRPDAIILANGRPAAFGGQKEPKPASDIPLSDLNKRFWKSDKGMLKPDKGFWKRDKGLFESDNGFSKTEKGMLESDKGFLKSDKGLSGFDKGFWKSDRGMSEPDKGFCNPDKGMSEPDFIRKMVKNLHLAGKCPKKGQFFSLHGVKRNFCSSGGDEAHSEKAEIGKRKAEMRQSLHTSSATAGHFAVAALCERRFRRSQTAATNKLTDHRNLNVITQSRDCFPAAV